MLRPFIIFTFNYRSSTFIKEIWGDDPNMANHLQSKFDGYAANDSNNRSLIIKFLSELSSDKLKDVEDHIKKNPNKYGI
jgi:hypothetical protein